MHFSKPQSLFTYIYRTIIYILVGKSEKENIFDIFFPEEEVNNCQVSDLFTPLTYHTVTITLSILV